jgi:hypothetical protein
MMLLAKQTFLGSSLNVSQVREPAFGTKMLHSVGLFVLQLSL